MEITCTECGKKIPATDVNIALAVAKCRYCDKAFHISPPEIGKVKLAEVKGVETVQLGGEITIIRRWFTPVAYPLVFFCISWNAILIYWYSKVFGESNVPLMMIIFPIGHVAVGLWLAYYTLCLFLNSTRFVIGYSGLKILHKPLPWMGSGKFISRIEIDQLYVKEKIVRGKNGSTTSFYYVKLKTTAGKEHEIATGIRSSEQARKIEQEIEIGLGIKDRSVVGEFR